MTQANGSLSTNGSTNGNGSGNGSTTADSLADSARTIVSGAAQTAREKLEAARIQVEDVASRAASTARDLSKQAAGGLEKANESLVEFVRARPLVAIGTSFVAGYLIISLLRRK